MHDGVEVPACPRALLIRIGEAGGGNVGRNADELVSSVQLASFREGYTSL